MFRDVARVLDVGQSAQELHFHLQNQVALAGGVGLRVHFQPIWVNRYRLGSTIDIAHFALAILLNKTADAQGAHRILFRFMPSSLDRPYSYRLP